MNPGTRNKLPKIKTEYKEATARIPLKTVTPNQGEKSKPSERPDSKSLAIKEFKQQATKVINSDIQSRDGGSEGTSDSGSNARMHLLHSKHRA